MAKLFQALRDYRAGRRLSHAHPPTMQAAKPDEERPMPLPSRMTAIAIREPGAPQVLVPQERDMPVPKPGEVLVKVAAAGVNRPDVMQREGKYPPPPGAPGHSGPRARRRSRRARRRREALEGRRQGLRARARRRLRRIRDRARDQRAAGDPAALDGRSRRDPRDVLHRLAQRVRARRAESRRDHADPWRLIRHRHDRDHAGEGEGCARDRHGRQSGEGGRLPASSAPMSRSITTRRISSPRPGRRRPTRAPS